MEQEQLNSMKAFWSRPEGKVGMIIPILIGVGLFVGWGAIVPFLLVTVHNTLWLAIYSLILAALLYCVFSKDFRRFLFYLYKSVIRWLTGQFIQIDPIGVLKTYKERLAGKLQEMTDAIGHLRGQILELDRAIRGKKDEYDKTMGRLQQAQKNPQDPQNIRVINVDSKHVTRLSGTIDKLRSDYEKLAKIVAVLGRYHEVSSDAILDMDREIADREFESKMAKNTHKTMKAAFGILRGLPDEYEMKLMAVQELEQRYTKQMGEVEQFLDMTKSIVFSANIEDGANVDKAMQLLDKWQGNGGSVLQLSKPKEAVTVVSGSYEDLLK